MGDDTSCHGQFVKFWNKYGASEDDPTLATLPQCKDTYHGKLQLVTEFNNNMITDLKHIIGICYFNTPTGFVNKITIEEMDNLLKVANKHMPTIDICDEYIQAASFKRELEKFLNLQPQKLAGRKANNGIQWWVWLIIALVALILLSCIFKNYDVYICKKSKK